MAGARYSQLEAKLADDENVEYTSDVQLRRSPHFFTSPSLSTAVAFCAGVLVALGSIRLFQNIGKRDTDWLSESSQCDTNLFGSENSQKVHRTAWRPQGAVSV